jgi:hypothetical protein
MAHLRVDAVQALMGRMAEGVRMLPGCQRSVQSH